MQVLQHFPGQLATIFLETEDAAGVRADGYAVPMVTRVILPDLSLATEYPQNMHKLDIGLYYIQYVIPSGAVAVGSYLVDIIYADPDTSVIRNTAVQIVVTAPFGTYTAVVAG